MARRRTKKRTHVGATNPTSSSVPNGRSASLDPKSMVIRIGAGEVGSSISQLATDVRRVMEPGTASRLKERRANRLRDYITMCGPLGVTHLLLFSRSESGNANLRIALAPRGPTLHFRIERYSLNKDVQRAQRHPKGGGKEYTAPPLLVMNNFTNTSSDAKSNVPKHLESLTTTVFQSLFPAINPQTTPLKSIRRVLLLNRERSIVSDSDDTFILNFRHYAITTKAVGLSMPLKRLNAAEKLLGESRGRKNDLPNLGRLQDIADYMIGGEAGEGYMTDGTSGGEGETDAEVEVMDAVPRKVLGAKARAVATAAAAEAQEKGTKSGQDTEDNVERRAIKLIELGPRMRLRLTKVEEGLCTGKVMWHEYLHKSREEVRELDEKWEQRRRQKDARRKQQKENVEKKKANVSKRGGDNGDGADDGDGAGDSDDSVDMYSDLDDSQFDSEGLEGDAEEEVNAKMEDAGEWEEEENEIAGGV